MGSAPVVRPADLPEGFELDAELPEGFTLDEPTVEAPGTDVGSRYVQAVPGAVARSLMDTVNPMTYARAVAALAKLGVRAGKAGITNPVALGVEFGPDTVELARGLKETASTPEGLAELTGAGVTAAITPGGLGKTGRVATDLARRSRITNLTRAVSGRGAETVAAITRAGDTAELPVSLTQGSLARKLAAREAAADLNVGATRAALPGEVPYSAVADRLPQIGENVQGVVVTGDRPLRRAVEGARTYWEDLATNPNTSGTIPRVSLAARKTEAQESARLAGAYAKREAGTPVAPRGAASAEEATAIREAVLDTTGLSPADAAKVAAYEKALAEDSLAKAFNAPAQAEHTRRITGVGSGDWKAALAGRVVAPAIGAGLGGAGGAMLGGLALSPAGALAGAGVATFMRSTLWNTMSAATKLKAIRALESGGVAAFREVVIPAAIADAERRRVAERALKAQGEGVTTP